MDPYMRSDTKIYLIEILDLNENKNNSNCKLEEKAAECLCNFGAKNSQMGTETTNHNIKG